MMGEIHILFDGPPGHVSGRFIDTVDKEGHGIRVGEWIGAGAYWHLVIPSDTELHKRIAKLEAELCTIKDDYSAVCKRGHMLLDERNAFQERMAELEAELTDTKGQVEEECGITKELHQRILSLRAELKCYTDSPVAVAALEVSRHHCQRADEAETRVTQLSAENAALKRKQKHGGD